VAFLHTPRRATVKRYWNAAIHSLVMIRLGQELGTDSDLAQAIAGGIDVFVRMLGVFLS
jgi:hypothetical protein